MKELIKRLINIEMMLHMIYLVKMHVYKKEVIDGSKRLILLKFAKKEDLKDKPGEINIEKYRIE